MKNNLEKNEELGGAWKAHVENNLSFNFDLDGKTFRSDTKAITPKPKPPKPKPPKPKPDPVPDPPPDPPKPKTWTEWLQNIKNLLLKLGEKALAALPGLIGAVVNFVLKSIASVVGYLADNLWAFALLVGGILYAEVSNFYAN